MRRPRWTRKIVPVVSLLPASLVLFIVYLIIQHHRHAELRATDWSTSKKTPLISERIVHLDFKGGAPRLQFLRDLVPLLASAGATALLVEYEDSFPYTGTLRNLSSRAAWSPSEVGQFLEVARGAGMGVIPLIPTLGHLELALKLPENAGLRESSELADTACPSEPAVRVLVAEMLRQVLELHPESTSVHLGFDEARLSSTCPRCEARQEDNVLVDYLKWAAGEARAVRPGLRIFIWDDMFRSWPLDRLSHVAQLWKVVEPMVWSYSHDVTIEIPPRTWLGYQRAFPKLWVATAYMGADGETSIIPDVEKRWQNHASWLRRAQAASISAKSSRSPKASMHSKPLSSVRGVVLTGWTRYDHFGLLCENLPLGVPSLVLMLALVTLATPATPLPDDLAGARWKELLRCPDHVDPPTEAVLARDPWLWSAGNCSFVGADLMRSVKRLLDLRSKVGELGHEWRCRRGWLSAVSIARNWTSTARLVAPQLDAQALNRQLEAVRDQLDGLLRLYFDKYTVAEWLYQNVNPAQARSAKIAADAKALRRRSLWSRGPASLPKGAKALDFSVQC